MAGRRSQDARDRANPAAYRNGLSGTSQGCAVLARSYMHPVKDATAVQQPGNLTATPQDTALAARSGRQVSVSLATYSKIGRLLFSHWPPGGAGMQTPPPAEHTSLMRTLWHRRWSSSPETGLRANSRPEAPEAPEARGTVLGEPRQRAETSRAKGCCRPTPGSD